MITKLIEMIQSGVMIETARLELLLTALLAGGHVLLEDVPGTGKTLVARALARTIEARFKRVQATPDLLPSDITGGAIYQQQENRFEFIEGPIFANIVLVDEINRASPRTQSSLLEAMAEGQVTTDGFSRTLPHPFFVIATQNPIDMAGTFPLPEAQLDRFLIALDLGYPTFEAEVTILEREEHSNPFERIQPVLSLADVQKLQAQVLEVAVARPLKEYIIRLNQATRTHSEVILGMSPRAGVGVQRAAQSWALLRGRTFATADDVKAVAPYVMGHRVLTRDRHATTARAVVQEILNTVAVPLE
ncbi:MAG: AAA family ATPase [Phototrophicaceae bacterium]